MEADVRWQVHPSRGAREVICLEALVNEAYGEGPQPIVTATTQPIVTATAQPIVTATAFSSGITRVIWPLAPPAKNESLGIPVGQRLVAAIGALCGKT